MVAKTKAKPATEDKLESAKRQGQAQFDSIRELVEVLRAADAAEFAGDRIDHARDRITENALSVQVRSDWHAPGAQDDTAKPAEYEILLCTGGPACRIVGTLTEHLEPDTARLEVQDWFQPWTEMRPIVGLIGAAEGIDYDSEPILLEYARRFWFGE